MFGENRLSGVRSEEGRPSSCDLRTSGRSAINTLRSVPLIPGFESRERCADTLSELSKGSFALGDESIHILQQVISALRSVEFTGLISGHKVSLGIIKPRAFDGLNLPPDDEKAAAFLMNQIGSENIIFTIPFHFSIEVAGQFYADVKEKYQCVKLPSGLSVWDSIEKFATCGPLTFILLLREEGRAVEWWRERMGKTRPQEADPLSIRGKFALQDKLPNNLVHGSDSVQSVTREVGILSNVLQGIIDRSNYNKKLFPTAETLIRIGALSRSQEIVGIKQIHSTSNLGQCSICVLRVDTISDDSKRQSLFLRIKSLSLDVVGFREGAIKQLDQLEILRREGVPILRFLGITRTISSRTLNRVSSIRMAPLTTKYPTPTCQEA